MKRGWKQVELSELVRFRSGGTPSKTIPTYWNGDIPWLTARDLKSFRLQSTHLCITNEGLAAGSRLVPAGTLVILVRGMTLLQRVPVCILDRPMAFNQDLRAMEPFGSVAGEFLAYALAAQNGRLRQLVTQAGHGTGRLQSDWLAAFPVIVPPVEYQREVVDVLATTDRAIAGLEKLIAVKRTLKKGLAQQLLTGQRRLPGFNKPWDIKRLGNIVTLHFSGIDKKIHTDEVSVCLCNYTDVYYNDRITNDMDFMQATASKSEIDSFSLKQWDVVITKDSETPDDIGKPAVVMHDMPGVVCGYHLAILRPKSVDGLFFAQLLRLPRTRYALYRIANGVTRFGLGQSSLRRLELSLPDQSEQACIAAVLGAADREIVLLEKKLAALRELKKGLMQKLLSGPVLMKA